jgi:hypothetical protein
LIDIAPACGKIATGAAPRGQTAIERWKNWDFQPY